LYQPSAQAAARCCAAARALAYPRVSFQSIGKISSAASSSSDEWQRVAKRLTSQLAARPNAAAQGGGLRLVYLVKSDLVLPDSKRSLLPGAKYGGATQGA
jgi:hypothetical protein